MLFWELFPSLPFLTDPKGLIPTLLLTWVRLGLCAHHSAPRGCVTAAAVWC